MTKKDMPEVIYAWIEGDDHESIWSGCEPRYGLTTKYIRATSQPSTDVGLMAKMAKVYEEEREKYLGGTVYYRNNQEAFEAAMTKALESQGYITQGWRPIETAKDSPSGEKVILYCPYRSITNPERFEVGSVYDGWGNLHPWATHWMLPEPPQEEMK